MISIVASVCMMGLVGTHEYWNSTKECKDIHLQFEGDIKNVTPNMCMMNGQMKLAKWVSEHPGWVVHKFKCIDPDKYHDI